jgi:hypothetical protein
MWLAEVGSGPEYVQAVALMADEHEAFDPEAELSKPSGSNLGGRRPLPCEWGSMACVYCNALKDWRATQRCEKTCDGSVSRGSASRAIASCLAPLRSRPIFQSAADKRMPRSPTHKVAGFFGVPDTKQPKPARVPKKKTKQTTVSIWPPSSQPALRVCG